MNRNNVSLTLVAILAVLAILLAASRLDLGPILVQKLQAQTPSPCGLESLRGSYGYQLTGQFLPGAPNIPPQLIGPFAAIGVVTFDAHGRLTGTDTRNANGIFVPARFSGTYTVAPNCTFSTTLDVDIGADGTIDIRGSRVDGVLVDGGEEMLLTVLDPGVVAFGTAKPQ